MFLLVAACGGGGDASQTPVARSFDQLAESVSGCGNRLRACMAEDPGSVAQQKCRESFRQCSASAGQSAEGALVDAINDCEERFSACHTERSASVMNDCTLRLRDCLGDASPETQIVAGAGAVRTHPPTYQCFGQLRECVTGSSGPKTCAQQARSCVTGSVGEPSSIDYPIAGRRAHAGSDGATGAGGVSGGAGGSDAGAGGAGAAGAKR
jgi:hypothetical protein